MLLKMIPIFEVKSIIFLTYRIVSLKFSSPDTVANEFKLKAPTSILESPNAKDETPAIVPMKLDHPAM